MKQEKTAWQIKMLAGYYKPYKGLFFADLFFCIPWGSSDICHSTDGSSHIMNSISEMS